MYRIQTDPGLALVKVEVSGFWAPEIAYDFLRDEQAAVRSLGVAPGKHRLLVDVRHMMIQSQETVEILRKMADTAMLKAERFAFVCGPGLIRTQVKRGVGDRAIRLFDTIEEAMGYLVGDQD